MSKRQRLTVFDVLLKGGLPRKLAIKGVLVITRMITGQGFQLVAARSVVDAHKRGGKSAATEVLQEILSRHPEVAATKWHHRYGGYHRRPNKISAPG